MTPTWKRGATVRILLDQFTAEEWAAIYHWTAATSEARYPGGSQALAEIQAIYSASQGAAA